MVGIEHFYIKKMAIIKKLLGNTFLQDLMKSQLNFGVIHIWNEH